MKKEVCLSLCSLIHWLCNLQGTRNLGLWHITNSNNRCRDYLVTKLLRWVLSWGCVPEGPCCGCPVTQNVVGSCGNPFVTAPLGFQVWTPWCEPPMWLSPTVLKKSLLCWVKVPTATFHSQPSGLQFPGEYLGQNRTTMGYVLSYNPFILNCQKKLLACNFYH